MELWDIKANALRLMFADSDINFSKEEFENGVLYANGNTREKLVRMNDSIRRAIDLYYQYCGVYHRKAQVKYKTDDLGNYTDVLDTTSLLDFGLPSRIDLRKNITNNIGHNKTLEYYYDNISKEITVEFDNIEYVDKSKMVFDLYYETKKLNLPKDIEVDDLTFDLDTLYIPEEVQRQIPKYIKGEIYEEDEVNIALNSKNEYIQFLLSFEKNFSNVQTRVKNYFPRG